MNMRISTGIFREHRLDFLIVAFSFLLPYAASIIFPSSFIDSEARLRDGLFKIRYALAGRDSVSPYIIHVTIDDASFSRLGVGTTERRLYARLIRAIADSGARLIACDVLFEKPADRESDDILIDAVRKAGIVYSPVIPLRTPDPGVESSSSGGTSIAPFDALANAAAGMGHIVCAPDGDGINRRFPLVLWQDNLVIPSLPLRIACAYFSVTPQNTKVVAGRALTLMASKLPGGGIEDIEIPIDDGANILINYAAPWRKSFYSISAADLISAADGNGSLRLNLRDVLENSIVFISNTSARNKDVGPGLFGGLIPYGEIPLTVTNMILTGSFLRPLSGYALPAMLLALSSLYCAAILFSRSAARIACTIILPFLYYGISVVLFIAARIILPLAVPLAASAAYFVLGNACLAFRSERVAISCRFELDKARKDLSRLRASMEEESLGSVDPSSKGRAKPVPPSREDDDRRADWESRALKNPRAFSRIITRNRSMIRIFSEIEAYKGSDTPILILGETGVGKELIAQAIHQVSGRSGKYVTVNVAGIDDQLFNDTLFGHRRGAFTGAERDESGFVAVAEGGTLFLDEIGDLSNASQIKLLRLIENKEYYPLNSKIPQRTDVRIIAATNADIDEKVRNKTFREDLSRRLGLRLSIPSLRERPEDIQILLDRFIAIASEKSNKPIPQYSPDLLRTLEAYRFPGNVRELESMVEEAISKNESGTLPLAVFRERILKEDRIGEIVTTDSEKKRRTFAFKGNLITLLEEIESAYIKDALDATTGNRRKAAKLLGVNYDWIKRRVKGRGAD
jgi:DNA-binding NtrC family response regulator/CHASE2 domain-containing sensor protein